VENPLHPFELHNYVELSLFGIDISITKAVLLMWVIIALVAGLLVAAGRSRRLVPTKLQSLAELLVDFIRGMILDTMGQEGLRFFPFIATLFLFILFSNLLGLIPGSYTVTSQIIVTAIFAVSVYGLSLIVGFARHGIKFFGILVPPGTPGWLLPLMMPIELISQLARPISLAVRLFANMMAGHTMLAIFAGFVTPLLLAAGAIKAFAIVPLGVDILLIFLELLVAALQAYVFTILTCLYLRDAIHLH